jgi:hypothetical protein
MILVKHNETGAHADTLEDYIETYVDEAGYDGLDIPLRHTRDKLSPAYGRALGFAEVSSTGKNFVDDIDLHKILVDLECRWEVFEAA